VGLVARAIVVGDIPLKPTSGQDPRRAVLSLRAGVASSCVVVLLLLAWAAAADSPGGPTPPRTYRYPAPHRVPPSLEAIYKQLAPGADAFPEEKEAADLAGRLGELGAVLRKGPSHAAEVPDSFLDPEFRGARLRPVEESAFGSSPRLEVFRAARLSSELVLDRASFGREIADLVADYDSVDTAEFLITKIAVEGRPDPRVRTTVRFDVAGPARGGGRTDRVGVWEMSWRRRSDWRVTEWKAVDERRSRAPAPIFAEATEAAFGSIPAFRDQLVPGLDEWASRLDAVFMPRGMGHHGVSVGDVDGDGLDDVYVSQPEGLPNRLFRNRGDGTFEDITQAAGVAVLERTSQALLGDVDNDGDQDLILLTRNGPMLFLNDGKAHFTRDPDAFQLKQRLQGSLTSGALADYDRDGFLDLYLCAYGYFIGVSEDKAGPPSPYHDALNGSPNVLLRNDGHGRFVETTDEVGLQENNDRFSFAPAWADYDEDGWPDLLVSNDFGRKNLYRQVDEGGRRRFHDEAAKAGVEDYGAGMSATFLDFDNDGHLDIYTGNMWTAAGQRVTALGAFKPDASPQMREIYRRHARGNSLFRNRGDGTFEDVTLRAGAQFGRWAWASDAFDFDGDGWEDLYVVNGMFTRDSDEPSVDVDSFFWRQVIAQSPLERKPGTPYDDGWRATNRLLVSNGAQAQHERNVLLRNDGKGGFDDVSGTAGLDVDQDGRSFAVLDADGDGRPDVVLLAPRSSPQLRLYRNDLDDGHAALALRLVGTKSNRDAIGARVTVEADQVRPTRVLMAGSGFLSQHSKELLFGLGHSRRILKVTIHWPSGLVQTLGDVPLNSRVTVREGEDGVRAEPLRKRPPAPAPTAVATGRAPGGSKPSADVWFYEPVGAPDFTVRDLDGQEHSLSKEAGRPALLLFWATSAPPSRVALEALAKQRAELAAAGVAVLALAVDAPADEAKVREAATGLGLPVAIAGAEVAGAYSILHSYLFDRREDLRLPTLLLLNGTGEVVKLYREVPAAGAVVQDAARIDASPEERLARAVPFAGNPYSSPGSRNYFQYGLELSEQGFDAPALAAFERVAKVDPSAITFFNLGTLYMKAGRNAQAESAFERALQIQPDNPQAANSFGALRAQGGDLPGAVELFRKALAAKPDFADALNNLGYSLFQSGQGEQALELYQKALSARPGFPEALNNLGIYYGQAGDLDRAREFFRQAVESRPAYGEAANNLALVLGAQGDAEGAIAVLQKVLEQAPGFEPAYVTLARIYLQSGRRREGVQALQLLLQRSPSNPAALAMLRQVEAGG
jgi:Tfp pilus assembly protein PilF/peroxiredoxin